MSKPFLISGPILIMLGSAVFAADPPRAVMLRIGGDPSRGVLWNVSTGAHPSDKPDPTRPTVVFVHGFNPAPKVVHFTMAERFAEALDRRNGPRFNILAWDWNAATFDSVRPKVNSENAVRQGQRLASAIKMAGIDPGGVHLIGHSAGGMVVTSAAHVFARHEGRPIAQLTLLDPATFYHEVIFERLEAGSLAARVENYWSPGPSAYGNEVQLAGVRNYRVDGTASYGGVVFPLRSDHISMVSWYLNSVENPSLPWGFNTSPLAVDVRR